MNKAIILLAVFVLKFGFVSSQNIGEEYKKSISVIEKGIGLYDDEHLEEALSEFNKVSQCDSNYYYALYEKALTHMNLKQYDKAIESCKEGLTLNSPEERGFYDLLGSSFDYKDMLDSALYYYNQGIKKFPHYHKYYFEIAVSQIKAKNDSEAYKNLIKSVQLNPLHAGTHLQLAMLAARNKQYTSAILAFQFFLLIENKTKRAIEALGNLEKICNNNFEFSKEVFDLTANGQNNFAEIDEIVKSRAAQIESYKSKIKIPFTDVTKQCQIISEKFKFYNSDKGFYNQFYGAILSKIWEKDYFDASMYVIFSGLNNEKVQELVKKNESRINAFVTNITNLILDYRKSIKHTINGVEVDGERFFYKSGVIEAVGKSDAKSMKTGKWFIYYSNGYLSAEGNYINDQFDGIWNGYYDNGTKRSEVNWSNGKKNGTYLVFYQNGQLKEKGNYVNNQLEGETIIYYSNGAVKEVSHFKNDMLSGIYTSHNSQGIKTAEAVYEAGKLNGKVTNISKHGTITEERIFKNGLCEGASTGYYQSGEVYFKGSYENNKRNGNWIWYYKNGKKSKEGYYQNDVAVKDWTEYHNNGNVSESYTYNSKGELDGEYKMYDEKGNLYMKSQFKGDKLLSSRYNDLNGNEVYAYKGNADDYDLKKYYPDGSLMEEGKVVNRKRNGLFTSYYQCGKKLSEMNYKDGVLDGSYTKFYLNGQKSEEYSCQNDEFNGYYRKYYLNGVIKEDGYYEKGKLIGPKTDYYKNGSPNEKYYLMNGDETGYGLFYDVAGKLYAKIHYSDVIATRQENYDTAQKIIQVIDFKNGTGKFVFKNYLNENQLVYEKQFGRKHGKQVKYHSNGKIKESREYSNGDLHGELKSYNYEGALTSSGLYKFDAKDGIHIWFDDEGKQECSETYSDGVLNGKVNWYYPNGKSYIEKYYVNDEQDSTSTTYGEDGSIAVRFFYKKGILLGYTYNDKSGQLLPMIPLKNETGDIVAYYANGKKSFQASYVNGQINGKKLVFYTSGLPYFEIEFYYNEYNGMFKEYHPNGKLKMELTYVNGDKNGVCKIYYDNGSLKKETFYLNNLKHGTEFVYDNSGKRLNSYLNINGETYKK